MQAGTYTNDFVTVTKDITLEGVGGMVHMVATVPPPNGKAIMTVNGDVTVRNFEFSGASVPDGNGAGIRVEGGDLTVEDCYFHDNEMGLLTGALPGTDIVIRDSEFGPTKPSASLNHGLYVGAVNSLTVENSYFHDAADGHEIKSRALATTITGSRIYDGNGDASYSIDIPNGGRTVISGNTIQQGPNSQNPAIVAYGAEGSLHAGSSLTMADNVVVNDLGSSGARLLSNSTSTTATITGTDVWGLSSGQIASGPASVSGTTYLGTRPMLDASSPWQGSSDQTLDGTAASEALMGATGNDLISGVGGSDTLSGAAGNDTLYGNGGKDGISGNEGNDLLGGGVDDDTLNGWAGNDTLSGGDGADRFVFTPGIGTEVIRGFDADPTGGQDLLDISAFGITAATFASAVSIAQKGNGTLLSLGGGTILLAGVSASGVDATDFVLAPGGAGVQAAATPTTTSTSAMALAVAAPTVLTFDEFALSRGAEQRLSGEYGGFTWGQVGVYRPDGALGYRTSSGNNLAFFGEATGREARGYEAAAGSPMVIRLADGGDFTFHSAAFSSASATSLRITAEAFDDGARVGSYVFTATRGTATVVSFDGQSRFSSIDELRFDAPDYFGFDDFAFTEELAPALPTLSIAAASAAKAEGAAGTTTPFTFTVTRAGDTSGSSTVAWAVTGSGGSPASASDFAGGILPSGTLSFSAGQTSRTITVNVAGDGTAEANEAFAVTLSAATGATITTGSATGTIQNDDSAPALPTLSIAAASAAKAEGAAGTTTPFTFTVTRAGDTSGSSTVAWAVTGSGGSPASASDFAGGTLPSGTLSFSAGQTSRTITVNVAGDGTVEANEAFAVTLSAATGATIATGSDTGITGAATITTGSATGTIQNDDTTSGGGSGTPVVDFALQNTASVASKAQYVQFMQVFAQGAVPSGSDLYAEVGGQKVPTQMEVTQRYADGSVKAAVITLYEPPIAAGTTLEGMLKIGAGATGADLPANAAIAAGYNLAVNMDIQGVGAVRIDAAAELTKAIAAGKAEILAQGPLATEVRVDVYVTSSLRVTLDITTFADGSIDTQVQFNNDRAMTSTGGTIRYNSISITQDGQTKFSYGALTQYQYQTWKIDVADSSSAEQTLNVIHDIDYAQQMGAFQNYDLEYAVPGATLSGYANAVKGAGWTEVLGVNGVERNMPMAGGRPDIGPTTEANAVWLMTQDQRAADYAMGQASAAGSVPWHMWDPAHDTYVSVDYYPRLWIDYRAPDANSTALTQPVSGSTGWTPDTAHQPDLTYTAYMLTGDRYYLDQLNAQASWGIVRSWSYTRKDGQGLVANSVEEVRSQAWNLRMIDEAAFANPDGSAEKAYFTKIANNNWTYLVNQLSSWTKQQGDIHGIIPGAYTQDITAPWQQDFFASTSAMAALRGNEDARAVLKWQANFLSGRFLSPEMDPHNGYAYNLNTQKNGVYYKTWGEVQQATVAAGNDVTPGTISAGYFAVNALVSNAEIITVFSDSKDPTDRAVAADAMKAYGWLLFDNNPYNSTYPQYQIAPRLADGRTLNDNEDHVVSGGGILSFAGEHALVYHTGATAAEIRGTAGADVLIDRTSQGGDTLVGGAGDDYLIGGAGRNLFTPGSGNDYVEVGRGQAIINVDPSLSGNLEIAGFRPGTDKLDLLLTADGQGAAILATAVQNAYGGTDLTISSTLVVTLDGLQASQLSTAMFM